MTDAELVEASRRGERAAFGRLVERYQDVVCAVGFSSTGDWSLSEDVAQDTFVAAWRQLDQLRETPRLRSWLCGIARNLGRKARRRVLREEPVTDDDMLPAGDATPFEHAERAESDALVRDALARMPEGYREVLVLYYREGHSIAKVASALGLSEAAALQRLARGRKHLADGVTDLVERSLRRRPTKSLVAGVLGAIAGIAAPSRVEASTKGSTMLKLAAAIFAVSAATVTTAVIAHSRGDDPTPVAAASPTAPVPSTAEVRHSSVTEQPALPVKSHALIKRADGNLDTPSPDVEPTISADTIARHGLYRGPSRGPIGAPVTVVVFQDNLCPYCGHALGTLDQLVDEFPGKIRLVVKQLVVHAKAELSAEALYAADAQGKFWELHDQIFQHQDDVSRAAILDEAKQVGLDVDQLAAALDAHTYKPNVDADIAAATAIEVRATPSFLINGRILMGALPIDEFRKAVRAALDD